MKGKKLILPLLLSSIVASPLVANFSSASILSSSAPVYAESIENINKINGGLIKVQNKLGATIKRGQPVEYDQMPKVTLDSPFNYTMVIKGPNGKDVKTYDQADLANASAYETAGKFTPQLQGHYTFSFRATGANTVTTLCDDIVVTVTDDTYTMTAPKNNYWALPSTVAKGGKLGIAVPEVSLNGADATLAQAFSQADYTGASDQTIASNASGLLVTITQPNGNKQYLTSYVAEANGVPAHYEFTPTQEGSHRVTFSYYNAGKVVAVINSNTSFRAVSNYDATEKYELKFTFNSSFDSVSKVLGREATLPSVKVTNAKGSANDTVDAYTKIIVTYMGGSANASDNAVVGTAEAKSVLNTNKYTYKWAGNYKVEYQVMIPNLGISSVVATKYISGVTDTLKPTISIVDGYTLDKTTNTVTTAGGESKVVTDMTKEELVEFVGDKSYTLNSVYQLKADNTLDVTIPAAIATDNYDKLSDITIKREVYRSGNLSDKLLKVDDETNPANQNAVLKFGTGEGRYAVGKYVVKYYAYDKAHPESPTVVSYNIEIKDHGALFADGEEAKAVPTVYMQYFDTNRVDKTEVITVNKPTATDYNSNDSNLQIETYFALDVAGKTIEDLMASSTKVLLNSEYTKDGKYVIDLSKQDTTTATTLYVFAVARNDYNSAKYGYAMRELTIRGTINDTAAPEFSVNTPNAETSTSLNTFAGALAYVNGTGAIGENGKLADGKAPFDQLGEITLPTVQFTDNNKELQVSVNVYYNAEDANKTTETMLEKQFSVNYSKDSGTGKYVHQVVGGSFVASYAGMYTVTYKAVDEGGNITAQSFGIFINDTVAPDIIVLDVAKFNTAHEVGKPFAVPEAQIKDNGELTDTDTITWTVESNGRAILNQPYGFTPLDKDEYYVVYTASDASGNVKVSQRYALSTKVDAKLGKPVFATQDFEREYDWTEDDKQNGSKDIRIPNATVTMPNLKEAVDVTITVKNGKNQTRTVTYVDELYSQFKADGEGVYTVSYSATDRFGRTTEPTDLIIYVGDWKAPEFSWKNADNKPKSEVKLDSTWKFDISMMDVTDENGNVLGDGITYFASMKGPDGKDATTNSKGEYVFDQVGNYTFRVTFEDKSGNTDYETVNISVTADTNEGETKTSTAVTTVLIVLSVVVLGGVVTYFVLSGRKKGTKKNKKK